MSMLYFDNAATTPVRPEVLDAMMPYLTRWFGNASSHHTVGEAARGRARRMRGAASRGCSGCGASDVVFTSGGTEANNLAVKGIAIAAQQSRDARHFVTTPIEHESILESGDYLARVHGFEVAPRDRRRRQGASRRRMSRPPFATTRRSSASATPTTRWAPCRTSPRSPPRRGSAASRCISTRCRRPGGSRCRPPTSERTRSRSRATSWARPRGRARSACGAASRSNRCCTAAARSAGAAAAPRTSPALWRSRPRWTSPRRNGSSHPRGSRALRDAFIARVLAAGAERRAHGRSRAPAARNGEFHLRGHERRGVLLELERRGVVSSSGSACAAGSDEPSHVLVAMGIPPEVAQTAVRFTFSHELSEPLDAVADAVAASVVAVRSGG